MSNLRKIIIDNVEVEVDPNLTLIQACEQAGIEVPRFAITSGCRLRATAGCVWSRWWAARPNPPQAARCR